MRARRLHDLVDLGTLTPQAASFLGACVVAGLNIIVTGGTQAGKTTLLNTFGSAVPGRERIVSVEEVFELRFDHPDWVAMQTRQVGLEGTGEIKRCAPAGGPFATGWRHSHNPAIPATQVYLYPSGTLRQFVGVVFMATALRRVGRVGDEAAELRWVAAGDLPDRLFAPDRPVLRDAFEPRRHRPVIG